MQIFRRPQLVVTKSKNDEERAAQIDRILDRLDRLRHHSEDLITEVAAVTREMATERQTPSSTDAAYQGLQLAPVFPQSSSPAISSMRPT